eukprot:1996900-Amphidinium_carterae.1
MSVKSRTASTTASLLVELVGVDGPDVDFTPLAQAKVDTTCIAGLTACFAASRVVNTETLRVSGNIADADVAVYGQKPALNGKSEN